MKAPVVTHGLKTIGFGNSMLTGIVVIGAVCLFMGDERRRERLLASLFGKH